MIEWKKPPHFKPLYTEKYVYAVLFGGRSSGKSHEIAEYLALAVLNDEANVLCCRQRQNSLESSSWNLVCLKIKEIEKRLNLPPQFEFLESRKIIKCANGRKMVFTGLETINEESIKSSEGFNYAWVEEAQYLRESSLDKLIPTIIRNKNPKVFFTLNPQYEHDAVYSKFIAKNYKDTLRIKVNYKDNPYNNEQIFVEAEECKADNIKKYNHIWLGECEGESPAQFFNNELIQDAMSRKGVSSDYSPLIIGCDNARMGDDCTVISMRHGSIFKILEIIKKNDDSGIIARKLSNYEDQYKADAVFVDAGYGDGVIDFGKTLNKRWTMVYFGGKSSRESLFNKRVEMYTKLKEWLQEGGALPNDPVLKAELKTIEYKPTYDGKIKLVSKDEMKKRGNKSPDIADSLALTFAEDIRKNQYMHLPTEQAMDY